MVRKLSVEFVIVFSICGIMLVVHAANVVSNYQFTQYGISPRHIPSLPFIYTAPFLHGNIGHLLNNLIGITIFSSLCLLRNVRFFLKSSFFIISFGGLMVWIFARPAIHIGASGWIFGLWSLSIAIAWFDRKFINIIIALFVVFFYGGMFYGVLPGNPRISFEAHLCGAISGIIYALIATKRRRTRRRWTYR